MIPAMRRPNLNFLGRPAIRITATRLIIRVLLCRILHFCTFYHFIPVVVCIHLFYFLRMPTEIHVTNFRFRYAPTRPSNIATTLNFYYYKLEPAFHLWLIKAPVNEGRWFICNVFSHWMTWIPVAFFRKQTATQLYCYWRSLGISLNLGWGVHNK